MNDLAKVFVSYTRRDGEISDSLLARIASNLTGISTPFVHALDDYTGRFQQSRVIWKLLCSQAVLLVGSAGTGQSPWVTLELLLSRIMLKPIIRIEAEELRRLLPTRGEVTDDQLPALAQSKVQ